LDLCIQKAIARHPGIAIAAIEVQASSSRLRSAEAQRLPVIGLSSGYLYSSNRDGTLDFVANNAPHETRAQVGVSWQPDTGALGAAVRRAQADLEAAGWSAQAIRARLALDVATAFCTALRTQHASEALAEAAGSARRQLQTVQRMVEAGKASRFDLQRTTATMASQEARLAQAEVDHRQALRRLALLIGESTDGPLAEPDEAKAVPIDDLAAVAETRPEVHRAAAIIQARLADQQIAERALWPQLSATASSGLDTGTWPSWQHLGWQAGLNLSWPIWDWGNLQSQADAARLAAARSEAERRLAVQTATTEVIDAEALLARAVGQLTPLRRAAEASKQAFEMASRGFAEGGIGSLEVLLAQQAAVEARIASQNAYYDYLAAAAYYRWATTGSEPQP
jgi:outer membrane protein TolC